VRCIVTQRFLVVDTPLLAAELFISAAGLLVGYAFGGLPVILTRVSGEVFD